MCLTTSHKANYDRPDVLHEELFHGLSKQSKHGDGGIKHLWRSFLTFKGGLKRLKIRIEISAQDFFSFVDLNYPNTQTNLNN
jgi:hypothetical protein